MKKKNTGNRKNNAAGQRHKRPAGFANRQTSPAVSRRAAPRKTAQNGRKVSPDLPDFKRYLSRNNRDTKMHGNQTKTENAHRGQKTTRGDASGETTVAVKLDAVKTETAGSTAPDRWYNNPRLTGAVAAVLLFATLIAAIIPTSLNARAEEKSETAALNPTMQLAKEYIYAGSRMLAIEDYGVSGSNPNPTPTPPPSGRTNVALAANGATVTASSTYGAGYPVSSVIDGIRHSNNQYGNGATWVSATNPATQPQSVEVQFPSPKTIDEIDVFTLSDAVQYTTNPSLTDTFTQYGVISFTVEYWNGSNWSGVEAVSNNNKVWNQFTFSPVSTNKIRVLVTQAGPGAGVAHLVEVEAWGGTNPVSSPTPTPTITPTPTPSGPPVPNIPANQYFQLVAQHSGKCADVAGGSSADTAAIHQWDCGNDSPGNQLWRFERLGDEFQIIAQHSNKCLEVGGGQGATGEGLEIQQYACLGAAQTNQLWRIIQIGSGSTYQIVAKHSGKCLDVPGANQNNEVVLKQYSCGSPGQSNQAWALSTPPTSTPTPTPTMTNNSSPAGNFDGIDGNNLTLTGWSYDPDDPHNSNDVHIYIGGPAGTGTGYAITANGSRPDVNNAFGISGNHGFSFQIPAQFNTGQWTPVYVYGIDRGTNSPVLLQGSPQYFGTAPEPTPTPCNSNPYDIDTCENVFGKRWNYETCNCENPYDAEPSVQNQDGIIGGFWQSLGALGLAW